MRRKGEEKVMLVMGTEERGVTGAITVPVKLQLVKPPVARQLLRRIPAARFPVGGSFVKDMLRGRVLTVAVLVTMSKRKLRPREAQLSTVQFAAVWVSNGMGKCPTASMSEWSTTLKKMNLSDLAETW